MRIIARFALFVSFAIGGIAAVAGADNHEWPRQIDSRDATIIVYQPQLESFENDILSARAAVSIQRPTDPDPIFGAVWFEAQVETDREERNVGLRNVRVLQSRFPDASKGQAKRFEELFTRQASGWDLDMSLDQMLTMLDANSRSAIEVSDLKNEPPRIIYRSHPALLVLIDGEPRMQPVDESKVLRVVNSPMYIVYESSLKSFYLKIGDEWFASSRVRENWRSVSQPPSEILAAAAKEDFPPVPPEVQSSLERKPEIVVSTEPAELIVTDGEPQYALIDQADLLYVSNSDSDIFLDVTSQDHYVVLSGRWFRSKTLRGQWEFVPYDRLPDAFANIPEGSPKEHVLAHVPDTVQAEEAILDATIPETERIDRGRTIDVTYDGEPEFVPVSGSVMAYAANSPYDVLRVDGRYYACHEAVWYVSASPYGPWRVAISVPPVIYTLPPSVPVYYVRYVYIYGYTPDIVYVGYTPGYLGTYVYNGAIVYGTGYDYRPWYRTYYYPRPLTWGFHVHYSTYYGWSFGVGLHGHYGNLWYSVGSGWWGPVHHRHHYYHDISYRYSDRRVIIKRPGNIYRPISRERWVERWREGGSLERRVRTIERDRRDDGRFSRDRAVVRDRRGDDRDGRDRAVVRDRRIETREDRGRTRVERETDRRGDERRPAGVVRERSRRDDVYTDRQGNIYRRSDKGWEKREKGEWRRDRSIDRSDNGRSVERSLNREYRARERGEERSREIFRSGDSIRRGGGDRGRPLTFPDNRGRRGRD